MVLWRPHPSLVVSDCSSPHLCACLSSYSHFFSQWTLSIQRPPPAFPLGRPVCPSRKPSRIGPKAPAVSDMANLWSTGHLYSLVPCQCWECRPVSVRWQPAPSAGGQPASSKIAQAWVTPHRLPCLQRTQIKPFEIPPLSLLSWPLGERQAGVWGLSSQLLSPKKSTLKSPPTFSALTLAFRVL